MNTGMMECLAELKDEAKIQSMCSKLANLIIKIWRKIRFQKQTVSYTKIEPMERKTSIRRYNPTVKVNQKNRADWEKIHKLIEDYPPIARDLLLTYIEENEDIQSLQRALEESKSRQDEIIKILTNIYQIDLEKLMTTIDLELNL